MLDLFTFQFWRENRNILFKGDFWFCFRLYFGGKFKKIQFHRFFWFVYAWIMSEFFIKYSIVASIYSFVYVFNFGGKIQLFRFLRFVYVWIFALNFWKVEMLIFTVFYLFTYFVGSSSSQILRIIQFLCFFLSNKMKKWHFISAKNVAAICCLTSKMSPYKSGEKLLCELLLRQQNLAFQLDEYTFIIPRAPNLLTLTE